MELDDKTLAVLKDLSSALDASADKAVFTIGGRIEGTAPPPRHYCYCYYYYCYYSYYYYHYHYHYHYHYPKRDQHPPGHDPVGPPRQACPPR